MKAAAVLARLFLCLAFVAGGGVASALDSYSPELKQKAEQGDAEAQYQLGLAYIDGRGIDKDDVEADKWIHLAAEQGYTEAQWALGFLYRHGHRFVERDLYKAYIWYVLAEEIRLVAKLQANLKPEKIKEELKKFPPDLQKKAEAKINYIAGYVYEKGVGVLPNYKKAARLYELSAKQGHAGAQERLGLMYLNGKGVAQDYGEAYIWFALLALNADGEIKEEAAKNRQAAEGNLTTDKLNQAQTEATRRLEEIKKKQAAAK